MYWAHFLSSSVVVDSEVDRSWLSLDDSSCTSALVVVKPSLLSFATSTFCLLASWAAPTSSSSPAGLFVFFNDACAACPMANSCLTVGSEGTAAAAPLLACLYFAILSFALCTASLFNSLPSFSFKLLVIMTWIFTSPSRVLLVPFLVPWTSPASNIIPVLSIPFFKACSSVFIRSEERRV